MKTADKLAEALRAAYALIPYNGNHDQAENERVRAGAREALAAHDKLKPSPANMVRKVCDTCGSENVFRDAAAAWDYDAQDWQATTIMDDAYCEDCDRECTIIDKPMT